MVPWPPLRRAPPATRPPVALVALRPTVATTAAGRVASAAGRRAGVLLAGALLAMRRLLPPLQA
eukprot:9802850-Alexandrium_andersonii.AAC.1